MKLIPVRQTPELRGKCALICLANLMNDTRMVGRYEHLDLSQGMDYSTENKIIEKETGFNIQPIYTNHIEDRGSLGVNLLRTFMFSFEDENPEHYIGLLYIVRSKKNPEERHRIWTFTQIGEIKKSQYLVTVVDPVKPLTNTTTIFDFLGEYEVFSLSAPYQGTGYILFTKEQIEHLV